uniref:MADS-box domain-containing protein n=1 Tax=Kalanchoe fedtschenkoi TaxID=63787 RepID=A0A7N1A1P6_KALFE
MTRRKVHLAWIPNASSRKATLRKRRECLMRKVMEISTLTGEEACGIVLSPEEGDPPVFWPPSINGVLDRFFSLPEADQCKKMTTLDIFMQEKISKMEEQVEKERRKARDQEINYVMHSIYSHGKPIDSLTSGETHQLFWFMEELKKKCELRILHLNQENSPPDSLMVPPQPPMMQSSVFPAKCPGQPQPEHSNSSDGDTKNMAGNILGINTNAEHKINDDPTNVATS